MEEQNYDTTEEKLQTDRNVRGNSQMVFRTGDDANRTYTVIDSMNEDFRSEEPDLSENDDSDGEAEAHPLTGFSPYVFHWDRKPLYKEKRSFWAFLILNTLTLGIYSNFYMYMLADDVNKMCEPDNEYLSSYVGCIILSWFTAGMYYFYWMYHLGSMLRKAGRGHYHTEVNVSGFEFLILSVLSVLTLGILKPVLYYRITDTVNLMAEEYVHEKHY